MAQQTTGRQPRYKRILLKLSGEALMGSEDFGIDPKVLDRKLGVMDLTAICLCRDHNMPLRVFNMNKPGALLNVVVGGAEGTLIEEDAQ